MNAGPLLAATAAAQPTPRAENPANRAARPAFLPAWRQRNLAPNQPTRRPCSHHTPKSVTDRTFKTLQNP